jgi:hypothetical protein
MDVVPPTRLVVLLMAALACVAAPATMLAHVHSPLRVASALVLFCLAPGAAALPLLAPRPASVELPLVFATSLAVSAVAAQTMLWLNTWSPAAATCALAAVSLASILAQLPLRPRRAAG